MKLDPRHKLYVVLAALFVTSLVVGDLVGNKLIEVDLFGWILPMPAGLLCFPVTFLLTDLVNEFYGKKAARFLTFVAFAMVIYTMVIVRAAVGLPAHAYITADYQAHYGEIFLGSQRILIASVTAFLIGQLLDIFMFNLLKRLTHNKLLWLRATGSTVASQLVDTVVVQVIAFSSFLTMQNVWKVVATAYVLKLIIAILLTPLIYLGHSIVEKNLGLRPVVLGPDGEPIGALDP